MVNHPNTILTRQGLTSGVEQVPVFFFFSEKAQKRFLFTIKKYYGFTCRHSIYNEKLF